MTRLAQFCLVIAFALFVVHEMDAMTHSEWLLLPVLSEFTEATGRDLFLLLHIPLFAVLVWALFIWKRQAMFGLVFCSGLVVHSIAHYALSDHPEYSFVPPTETITVYGAALVSAIYLCLRVLPRRS